jgi:hypothetical protein
VLLLLLLRALLLLLLLLLLCSRCSERRCGEGYEGQCGDCDGRGGWLGAPGDERLACCCSR